MRLLTASPRLPRIDFFDDLDRRERVEIVGMFKLHLVCGPALVATPIARFFRAGPDGREPKVSSASR